ncbi:IS5/IS1182 family transposase, partial [Magnetococcus sp. PR-3]
EATGLDAGYNSAVICKGLEDRLIHGVVGYRRSNHPNKELFYKREYLYDAEGDYYQCPKGYPLIYRTTN